MRSSGVPRPGRVDHLADRLTHLLVRVGRDDDPRALRRHDGLGAATAADSRAGSTWSEPSRTSDARTSSSASYRPVAPASTTTRVRSLTARRSCAAWRDTRCGRKTMTDADVAGQRPDVEGPGRRLHEVLLVVPGRLEDGPCRAVEPHDVAAAPTRGAEGAERAGGQVAELAVGGDQRRLGGRVRRDRARTCPHRCGGHARIAAVITGVDTGRRPSPARTGAPSSSARR